MVRILNKFSALLLALLLAVTLAACSNNNRTASQNSVSLSPVAVDGQGKIVASQSPTTLAFVLPTATPEPTIAPPSPTTLPTSHPPISTPTGAVEKVDKEYELGIVKKGYDAISLNFYRVPDTARLLQAAITETGKATDITVTSPDFNGGPEANWEIFAAAFGDTLDKADAKGWKYPKGELSHRVVSAIAFTLNDGHTYFMDKAATQSRQNLYSGKNSTIGFGIVVVTDNNKAYIVRVVANSPADKAGLKAADQMVAYDGQAIDGSNWQMIRNAKENEVHDFSVVREGVTLTLKIAKGAYSTPIVEYRLINGKIGYIAIRDFYPEVTVETDKAMRDLSAQGAQAWIVDVRGNPGGQNFQQVAGRFVEGGKVMGYVTNRSGRNPEYTSNAGVEGPFKNKPFSPKYPMAILIDENSASASEIVALVFRDFKLGPVIGAKSAGALGYGRDFPLGDGTSINVTVDEYESAGGEKANGVGVIPDIAIAMGIPDLVAGRDPQLAAAIEQVQKNITAQKP